MLQTETAKSSTRHFIDTFKVSKRLEAAKFTKEQVEAIIEVNNEYIDLDKLATKDDLKLLRRDLLIQITGAIFALLVAFKVFEKFI